MLEAAQVLELKSVAVFRSRLRQLVLAHSAQIGRHVSQSELARETGVSLPTIQRWHDPQYTFNRIDSETLFAFLDYFHCKFEDLIERAD